MALLAMAGTAVAETHGAKHGGKHGAKVYRAALAPIDIGATAPTGDTTPTGGTSVSGKAHLVDGRKKNNILTIHAKGLTTGTTYAWHLHAFPVGLDNPCVAGAPVGALDTSFAYGKLTGNSAGNVDIHDPLTDAPIACGVPAPKAHKTKTKTKTKKHGKGPVAKAPKAPKAHPNGKK